MSYATGVALPSERFTDNNDGTVTDNLTGLIWLKDMSAMGTNNWDAAFPDSTKRFRASTSRFGSDTRAWIADGY